MLKQRITVGDLDRLRRRANKKRSGSSCIPAEYLENPSFSGEIAKIQKIVIEEKIDISNAMYALALKQLVLRGELADAGAQSFTAVCCCESRRKPLAEELAAWRHELSSFTTAGQNVCSRLFDTLIDASHDDTLGIIYQSLMQTGCKSHKGSFYTPPALIDAILKEHARPDGAFLDPCCGTGQFLLRAARHGYDPGRLYGIDSDLLAVRIARINLLLAFPDIDFSPRIIHADTLLHDINEEFTLIASNPPYIAEGDPHLDQGDLRFEPPTALSSGADGLDAIRTLATGAPAHLRPGGWLLLEHGWDQGPAVRALLAAAGFEAVATHRDLEQRDRVTLGRRP